MISVPTRRSGMSVVKNGERIAATPIESTNGIGHSLRDLTVVRLTQEGKILLKAWEKVCPDEPETPLLGTQGDTDNGAINTKSLVIPEISRLRVPGTREDA